MLAIVPNFASFQVLKISICEMTTAIIPIIHHSSFFKKNKMADDKNNKNAVNQRTPNGLEISLELMAIFGTETEDANPNK